MIDPIVASLQHTTESYRAGLTAGMSLAVEPIIARLWSDVGPEERPADLVADLLERHAYWQKRAQEAEATKGGA